MPDNNYEYDSDVMQDVITGPLIEIPEKFTPCSEDNKDNLHGPFYKTADVVKMIGVDRQTIIRYVRTFEEYLSIRKTPAGDNMYTEEAARQLLFLINDRRNHNRTLPQELDYIRTSYGAKSYNLSSRTVAVMEEMFNTMQQNILDNIGSRFDELENKNQLQISEIRKQSDAYEDALAGKDAEIERLKNELAKKDELIAQKDEQLSKKKKRFFNW